MLRLTDADFYALTPRQFDELLKRHKEEREFTELGWGLVCATVANFSMGAPKQPLQPSDFMPSQWTDKKTTPAQKKRVNRKVVASSIRGLMTGYMSAQATIAKRKTNG